MKKRGLAWEVQKLKDEMSDLRAALRHQLNLVADRFATYEHEIKGKWGERGRRLHDLEVAVRELKEKALKPMERERRKARRKKS